MPVKKNKKENGSDIEETIKDIKSRFGEETIMKLGDRPNVSVEAIKTGSLGLDWALGIGGVPRGRIIEIFGPESSGKSTLALHIVAEAQKKGGICAFIDAEHALDPQYSKKLGVKTKELLISQPDYGEQALEIADSLIRSGKIDVVVIDSVAALTPKDEIEGDVGAHHVGKQARLMSQALRKITANVARSKTVVIFINQIRMKIGVMFGCFSYDSSVLLSNGKKELIGKIVNNRLPVKVLSYNFDKKIIEEKEVIDWHINGKTEEFLQFSIQNHTGNGRRGFSCTPDHKIYTPRGWKKAKELKVGDKILVRIKNATLSPEQEEIIIGSLLGDGNIKKKAEQTAYFREEHGPKQTNYVKWLSRELGNVVSNTSLSNKRGNAIVETKHLLQLGDIHKEFYPTKKKIVPEYIVDNITPRMLALWYCGDGSLQIGTSKWKNKTYKRRPRAALYVNGFQDDKSRSRIDRIFQKFNIHPTWRKCGEYKVLYFPVLESKKFFEIISPFIPKAMEYKLPEEYKGRYEQKIITPTSQSETLRAMKIKDIKKRIPYKDGARTSKNRFDITVADNHNYFVDDCLVSNSPETTPGGKALKFYSSVRLDVRRIAQIKKGEEVIGGRVRVKVVKNKVAAPFRMAEFDLLYNEGISPEGEILSLGEKYNLISKNVGSYTYHTDKEDIKLGRGYDVARNFLKENKDIRNKIIKDIEKATEEI